MICKPNCLPKTQDTQLDTDKFFWRCRACGLAAWCDWFISHDGDAAPMDLDLDSSEHPPLQDMRGENAKSAAGASAAHILK